MPTSSDAVIRLDNVSKRYSLRAGQESLRSLVGAWGSRLLRRNGSDSGQDHFWALKDLAFEVRRGEALGIIGPNGAGKTTILKLLSRITPPTSGTITLVGRSSSLLELGAGFHPDLTGRENIFLNGVILGLTRRQIKERFDQIVAFAELERFIDMPVKRYSSGMYARLGFAVAAHVDPDIMLVDEVLAVGDAGFQRKCYDFIHAFVTGGKTTVFVSHNLYVIEQLCDRVIWLDGGQIVMAGQPGRVLPAYLDHMDQKALVSKTTAESVDGHLRVAQVDFTDAEGNRREAFTTGESITINIKYQAERPIASPHFVLGVVDAQGGPPLFLASMLVDGNVPPSIAGEGVLKCKLGSVPLMPRVYYVWGEIWAADRTRMLMKWQRLASFRVSGTGEEPQQEVGKGSIRHQRVDAPIRVPYTWDY
ncbi:MAG: ABC transporter ATP-binding protein [Anaerolineae bacterium]|nr:ABC transporter ATP-binding protein [Anaerolineae bacterium]